MRRYWRDLCHVAKAATHWRGAVVSKSDTCAVFIDVFIVSLDRNTYVTLANLGVDDVFTSCPA